MSDIQKTKKTEKIITAIKLFIVIIFFSSVFVVFLKINLWDYDFWWHIATGRYIVTEKHLPDKDPFSFTSELQENKNAFPERESFILKQYWLAQSLFYLVFNLAGAKGIILLRSLILVLTLFAVFWHLQKGKVSAYISFLFLFLLFDDSTRAIGERPVLFSYLFSAVVFLILDNFRIEKGRKIFLLPPLMLLWANLHGGFILGDIIIAVFLLGESINIYLRKSNYSKQQKVVFYSVSMFAIACSFLNPNGWDAFSMSLSSKYEIFTNGIQEYQPPFYFYINKIRPIQYNEVILAVMAPLILILRNRKLNLNHVMLLAGFYYMAVTASRFIFFYAIIATMIVAKETDIIVSGFFRKRLQEKSYKKIEYILTVAALCSIALFMIGHFKYKEFEFKVAEKISVPEAAVDFIENNRLPGNIFNSYGYGGYLAWRLYPWKKNFFDSRSLNITTMNEGEWIIQADSGKYFHTEANPKALNTPLWELLLAHYRVNFVLIPLFDIYGNIMPLVLKTLESDTWVPLYYDPISLVLIKNSPENRPFIETHRVQKDDIYNFIIYRASSFALSDKTNPRHLMALADTFHKIGRLDDAIKAYEYALKRMPESSKIKAKLDMLKSEREENKDVPKASTISKPDQ
jgi:hypothetical protein